MGEGGRAVVEKQKKRRHVKRSATPLHWQVLCSQLHTPFQVPKKYITGHLYWALRYNASLLWSLSYKFRLFRPGPHLQSGFDEWRRPNRMRRKVNYQGQVFRLHPRQNRKQ